MNLVKVFFHDFLSQGQEILAKKIRNGNVQESETGRKFGT
jgi:hypothetical protein